MNLRNIVALTLVSAFVLVTSLALETANAELINLRDLVVAQFDWFFTGVATVCLAFVAWFAVDPRFNVRLGGDHERPEFSNLAWFAMLFSAGLASGILYWSTGEPIAHFQGNPHLEMAGYEPLTAEAAQLAMTLTIFHWGLHGWGFYVVVGLGVAWFAYRHDLPVALSTALHPVLGDYTRKWPGQLIDLFGVLATVFGVATSIGLAVSGMNAAIAELVDVPISITSQLAIIALVAALGIGSAISGVAQGIRRISELNVWISAGLLAAIFIIGPSLWLLQFTATSLLDYVLRVIPVGIWTATDDAGRSWQSAWTVFYWGWWLAWAPFVGLFIARISRGRTVREFVIGVMLVPSTVVVVWMSILGGTVLHGELNGAASLIDTINADYAVGTVAMIKRLDVLVLPLVAVLAFLLFTWLITSVDSATLVICGLLAEPGAAPSAVQQALWGVLLGLVTGLLLYIGGVTALQSASIIAGLPIGFVVLAVALGIARTSRSTSNSDES